MHLSSCQYWQLLKGYAIGSINVRISTIKKYCELATAGVLSTDDLLKIRLVKSYRYMVVSIGENFYFIRSTRIDADEHKIYSHGKQLEEYGEFK